MTLVFYNSKLKDADGGLFVGQVFWDKLHRGRIWASICPLKSEAEADYPIWKKEDEYNAQDRQKIMKMIGRLKAKAGLWELEIVSEGETEFCPKS